MKTLAIRQPWISLIAEGEKTIEARTWKTAYRGPLLLVASGKPLHVPIDDGETYTLPTHALAARKVCCLSARHALGAIANLPTRQPADFLAITITPFPVKISANAADDNYPFNIL